MTYQEMIDALRDGVFDTDTIMNMASNFPSDPNTNPIGTYGVGMNSDARHQAASARASDRIKDGLDFMPWIPNYLRGPMADTVSLAGGGAVELGGSLFDWAKSGFKDHNYLTAAKEDMASNWKGTFGTEYGVPTNEIMEKVYAENGYPLNKSTNTNIFNQGTLGLQEQQIEQGGPNGGRAQVTQGGLGPNGGRAQAAPTVLPAPIKSTPVKSVSPGGGNSRRSYTPPAATSPSVSQPRARATRGRSAPVVRQSKNGPPQNRFR